MIDPPWDGSEKCRMLTSQTRRQMTEMTLASMSPKSSSFFFRGVFSVIWEAIEMEEWMSPMAVLEPMATTTARAVPLTTVVPCTFVAGQHEMYQEMWKTTYGEQQVGLILLDGLGVMDLGDRLVHADTLSGQDSLVDSEGT